VADLRHVLGGLRRSGALVVAASLLAACGGDDGGTGVVSDVVRHDTDGLHGSALADGWPLPAVSLEDTDGEPVDLTEAADDPLTMVFFGYTHCPDICLAVMADVTSALNRLEAEEAEQVDVWFVTTDPARDDGPAIREWLDRFDPEYEGFTGPLEEITRVAEALHVPIEKGRRLPTGGYEVNHGTPVLGVLAGGEAKVVWTEGTSAAKLAEDIRTVLEDPSAVGGDA
jgi:protein SCO1/2